MIALASDHAGFLLKEEIKLLLNELNLKFIDYGTNDTQSVDYPIFAARAAKAILKGECSRGIIFCGTGVGISIAANKFKGIRCVVCSDCFSAQASRNHNNTNMLALGARVIGPDLARMIVKEWLFSEYDKEGERHIKRLSLLDKLDNGEAIE